jgi:hypothetical protein
MTDEKSYDWKLEGDYFDGCNCKSICPCIFALDPTEGDCKGLAAWHIEKGHFTNEMEPRTTGTAPTLTMKTLIIIR